VVQDATGAIEVLLPIGTAAPRVGAVLRIAGLTAHAWGAPRLRATGVTDAHASLPVQAPPRTTALAEADEWHLLRLTGTILKVERIGDRWRADLRLAGQSAVTVPILGMAGSGIPSTAIISGRVATIVGIAKRPYPTATDRRFGLVPRGSGDVAIGPAPAAGGGPGAGGSGGGSGDTGGADGGGILGALADVTPDTDLATLRDHLGARVTVGGLIASLAATGFGLDDGTATARVVLSGDALDLLPYLEVGDALAASGTVAQQDDVLVVEVASGADLVRVGDLGQALPVAIGSPSPGSAQPGAEDGIGGGPTLASTHGFDAVVAPFGLAAMLGLSALSLAGTLVRRRQERRRLRAVIASRLAALRPIGNRARAKHDSA
jgi:hypothetical protein